MNTIAQHVGVSAQNRGLQRDQLAGLGCYEPPNGELEQRIADCWRDVTGFDRVGATDDFFALGGTSVQAAAIFSRLESELGASLPLSTLYRSPTVRGLAGQLAKRRPVVETGRVVAVKSSGNKTPLFVAPGVGGGVVGLAYLANALNIDRPVYGFESRGLNRGEDPLADMGEIAAEFVDSLRRIQPRGPYQLLGICWGGIAALEVARQLRAAGEQVANLFLLDPPLPRANGVSTDLPARLPVRSFVASRLKLYWRTLRDLPAGERRAYLGERLRVLADIVRQRDMFRGDDSEFRRRKVQAANRQAVRSYRPSAVDCPVRLLFTSDRAEGTARDSRSEWLEILRPDEAPVYVPGVDTGNAIAPELAHHVADALRPYLD